MRLPLATALLYLSLGCSSPVHSVGKATLPLRQPEGALALSRSAAEFIPSDLTVAEEMLREALELDPFCGPAHNNLGAVLLKQGHLDEAAAEFRSAARLLPGHADPAFNLELTISRIEAQARARED